MQGGSHQTLMRKSLLGYRMTRQSPISRRSRGMSLGPCGAGGADHLRDDRALVDAHDFGIAMMARAVFVACCRCSSNAYSSKAPIAISASARDSTMALRFAPWVFAMASTLTIPLDRQGHAPLLVPDPQVCVAQPVGHASRAKVAAWTASRPPDNRGDDILWCRGSVRSSGKYTA